MPNPLSKEQETLLDNLYYKQKNYVGRDKLWYLTKQYEGYPTQRQVNYWLQNQEVNQLHRKPKKSLSIAPVIVKKPNIYYQADLVDMGNKASHNKRYIFTLTDVFTKQAYAIAMTNKSNKSVLSAFEKIYELLVNNNKSIKILQTDNGGEFISSEFQDFLTKHKIKHTTSIPGRPQSNGQIERFNGILKDYIMKDITALGKNEWPLHLKTYIENYNNTYHTTIKTTPNQAAEKFEQVYTNIKQNAVKHKLIVVNKFKEGDKVRIKIFKGKLDKASTQNWSKSIFVIHRIIKSDKPFVQDKFRIKNQNGETLKNFYSANDLLKVLKVNKSTVTIPKDTTPNQIMTRSRSSHL